MNEKKNRNKERMTEVLKKALKAAFPCTLPILAAYGFLGFTYGIMMRTSGYAWYWPLLTATIVYTGSLEFLLISQIFPYVFHPLQVIVLGLVVGARHIFYGISNLERFRGMGWKKFFLIYWESDETFSIIWSTNPDKEVDRGWFYFWISALDMGYWACGAVLGDLFGGLITFSTEGLSFVSTAMFVAIFMDNWTKERNHTASLLGIGATLLCLLVFGADIFILPAMVLIVLVLLAVQRPLQEKIKKEEAHL